MTKGYLTLVLHAHLPFVRHPESENYLEERWLHEAITESYIPLLQVFKGLVQDEVDFRITMSLSPTLLSMLTDELLQERYLRHLEKLIELSEKEIERTADDPQFNFLAREYANKFSSIRDFYMEYKCNLTTAFCELQNLGKLELITSAATHAFLPLVMTEEAIRAQIRTAVDLHERLFHQKPRGIWLPECGFAPGLDRILKECGIDFFFVDSHGIESSDTAPVFGTLSPVLTPHRVAAFPRDQESSKQVWSSQDGYPGDPDYREYYRDIGYDLDFETIKPYIHPDGIRTNTGIKYYRITGRGVDKEPYNPGWARERAAVHAGNFLFNRVCQVEHGQWQMGRKPLVVAPYDAELFGHWWYEGPIFIDMLMRKIHFDQQNIKTITPTEYLRLYSDYQVCSLPMSSWGRGGYADVWLRMENDWIYPALHNAENRMVELANRFQEASELERRALNQMARELMLMQSSDFAFIMDNQTMVDYAVKRTKHHMNRFNHLYQMLNTSSIDEKWLSALEKIDPLFPDMDYRAYRSSYPVVRYEPKFTKPRILMLSWEFPPMTVGGLSRHVYDLSRYLARCGWEVHVVTTEIGEYPHYEIVDGVHVHRVHVMKPDGGEFIHWAFQLNLMMIDTVQKLVESGLTFDVVHAHDWLVCVAAKTVKELYGLPLVATIHATEHGRNHGIHNDLQQHIHHLEWLLTYEASRVILCSTYMKHEAMGVFSLPADKLDVIPNGVDPEMLQFDRSSVDFRQKYAPHHERFILFIGRVVIEKGVHTLVEAFPSILGECPHVKLIIAGTGPALQDVQHLAEKSGVSDKIQFAGYITDEERNWLMQNAAAAVFPSRYEPFGIVALEAMAAGAPTVVSDVGGLADIVQHGHNGLKMYPNDSYSLANQVKSLLQNSEWAKRLSETAFKEIGKYDWVRIAEQTIHVYKQALGDLESNAAKDEIAATLEGEQELV